MNQKALIIQIPARPTFTLAFRVRPCPGRITLRTRVLSLGFPDASAAKCHPAMQDTCGRCRFDPGVGKIPWRRTWHPTPVFLPGESHGQRSLVGYSPWGHNKWDKTECLNDNVVLGRVASELSYNFIFCWKTCAYLFE